MKNLRRLFKKHTTLVFLDFEGTQFSHEIIAIGAIKCKIDQFGNIVEESKEGFKRYVLATNPVGKIISEMTHITDEILQNEGISFEQALNDFASYVGEEMSNVSFVVFGSNDALMLVETKKYSQINNIEILWKILTNIVDFQAFLSQYCRDKNSNIFSLVNYLKHFNCEDIEESHDPLNDAINLKRLYQEVLKNQDILREDYKEILYHTKVFPYPIKQILKDLADGKKVSAKELDQYIKEYLS